MKSKFIAEQDARTLVVVFDKGEDVVAGLLEVAESHNMSAAGFTAIGALSDVRPRRAPWGTERARINVRLVCVYVLTARLISAYCYCRARSHRRA